MLRAKSERERLWSMTGERSSVFIAVPDSPKRERQEGQEAGIQDLNVPKLRYACTGTQHIVMCEPNRTSCSAFELVPYENSLLCRRRIVAPSWLVAAALMCACGC